jgi:polar amino acid transport system permease protein
VQKTLCTPVYLSDLELIVTEQQVDPLLQPHPVTKIEAARELRNWRDYPWWFVALVLIAGMAAITIINRESYRTAFIWILAGIKITVSTSLISYAIAIFLGLLAGLGRISRNVVLNNLARLYVELIRGIPMLVLIFFIALVGVPTVVDGLNTLGFWFEDQGVTPLAVLLTAFNNQSIPMNTRAIVALSITYGAFLAEIFRAGIQSIGRGQMEAARSVGMSNGQAMRYVILPQAIRNVLPALGNDFVAMVKDSSLVSVLAVRDITQVSRLYAGSTFRFKEAYMTLAVMYLTMTVALSLVVQAVERRLRKHV